MGVTAYESLNLLFSSCLMAHLPLCVLSAISNSITGSSKPWTQVRKIQRSIILLVKFSWALRPKQQYWSMSRWSEPWWEKRNWHLYKLRGSEHQQNCFGGLMARSHPRQQRDMTPVPCRDWHIREEPKVPAAPSRVAGNQPALKDPSSRTAERWYLQKVYRIHFKERLGSKNPRVGLFLKPVTHPWRAPGSQWDSNRRKKKLWASVTWMYISKWLYLYQQAGEAWDIGLTWSNLDYS